MSDDEQLPQSVRTNNGKNGSENEIGIRTDNVTTRYGVVNLDSIYLDKIPNNYAKSLLDLSASVNRFLQTERNIRSDKVTILRDNINALAERLMYVDPSKDPTYIEKKFISADMAMVAGSLLSLSPKIYNIIKGEPLLIPFGELTSESFLNMIDEIKKDIQ